MPTPWASPEEAATAVKFAAVGLIGLTVDAILLRVGLGLGLTAAQARIGSLLVAMQFTFTINGLLVFRRLTWPTLSRQWPRYMAGNGAGNFCNYWAFVTLVSTHWPVIANPYFALAVGGCVAYSINYAATRLLVFGKARAKAA